MHQRYCLNLKVLNCQRHKYKYINHTYFLLYVQTLLDLDLKYFSDSWFYNKFIHHLKLVFKIKASQPEIHLILNKIVRYALEKKSKNLVYNKYKFFINNLDLYNNFLFDLGLNKGTSGIFEFFDNATNQRTSTRSLYFINPNSLKIGLSGLVLSL